MSPRLLRLLATLRHRDAERVDEVFPLTRRTAILAAIVAGESIEVREVPAIGSRRRRAHARRHVRVARPPAWVLAAIGAGAAAAVALAVVTSTPAHRSALGKVSPVSFRYPVSGPDSGDIIATVTDPFAAQGALDAAFAAAGLHIAVALVPASPSAVGTVVEISEPSGGPQIETLTGGTCVTGGGGPGNCPIGLRIPRDFTGSGSITLGRPARPGEAYESTNSAFAPGETLHCSALVGATVATATSTLASRGLTARWQVLGTESAQSAKPAPTTTRVSTSSTSSETTDASTSTSSSAVAIAGQATPPPGTYHVVDGDPIEAGVVMLEAQPDPLSAAQSAQAAQMYGSGC